jgi:hypothetical protein
MVIQILLVSVLGKSSVPITGIRNKDAISANMAIPSVVRLYFNAMVRIFKCGAESFILLVRYIGGRFRMNLAAAAGTTI